MARTPASIRNNNPGAMYPGPSARRFGSTSFETLVSRDGTHKIATFMSPVQGAAAQFDLLARNYCGMSVKDAITKWCGDYYTSTYLDVLARETGIRPEDELTPEMIRNASIAVPIAKAMALQEAGRPFPMSDAEWFDAHALAFPPAPATLRGWEPDNDMPTPKAASGRPVESMAQSTTGNTAVALGGGAGVPQVGMAASDAAARSRSLKEFFVALLASPLFWTGVMTVVGAAYIWFERRRKLRDWGI